MLDAIPHEIELDPRITRLGASAVAFCDVVERECRDCCTGPPQRTLPAFLTREDESVVAEAAIDVAQALASITEEDASRLSMTTQRSIHGLRLAFAAITTTWDWEWVHRRDARAYARKRTKTFETRILRQLRSLALTCRAFRDLDRDPEADAWFDEAKRGGIEASGLPLEEARRRFDQARQSLRTAPTLGPRMPTLEKKQGSGLLIKLEDSVKPFRDVLSGNEGNSPDPTPLRQRRTESHKVEEKALREGELRTTLRELAAVFPCSCSSTTPDSLKREGFLKSWRRTSRNTLVVELGREATLEQREKLIKLRNDALAKRGRARATGKGPNSPPAEG